MAYWQRKPNGHVFVYYRQDGKTKTVPRSRIKHLDDEPDHNVAAWVEAKFPSGKRSAPYVEKPDHITRYLDLYLEALRDQGKAPKTVLSHKQSLDSHIIPYFLQTCQEPEIGKWFRHTSKLTPHLRERGASEDTVSRCNAALRGFWNFLRYEGAVPAELEVLLRPSKTRDEPTPLRQTKTPKDILTADLEGDMRLLGLLGYFFSLRPQETLALRKRDFLAGTRAGGLEACKVMKRHGLYSKFAVNITRQRTQAGELPAPKAYSKGWVACFSEDAAKEIVALLKERDPDELLFGKWQNDWWYTLWGRTKLGGLLTLKDLRRASLYWLGHYTNIDFVVLKNHARHRKPETTMQYLRRPEEAVDEEDFDLDLDA